MRLVCLLSLYACGPKAIDTDIVDTDTDSEPIDTATETDTDTDTDSDADSDSDADADGIPSPTTLKDVVTRFDGIQGFGLAGTALASLPDTDGDGDDEWLVGCPNLDNDVGGAISSGGLYLMAGGTVGSHLLDEARAIILGENNDDHLGNAVAAADLDGDGASEFVIAASKFGKVGLGDPGALYLFPGTVSGEHAATEAQTRVYGENDGDEFGASLATGDVGDDARLELIVGAPAYNVDDVVTDAGIVYVFAQPLPSLGFVSAAGGTITGLVSDRLGEAMVVVGDMLGDGVGDLLVGDDGRGFSLEGEALIFDGPLTGIAITALEANRIWTGVATADGAGHSVAAAGDADGDGLSDAWVGVPGSAGAAGEAVLIGGAQEAGSVDTALARLKGGTLDSAGTSVAGNADINGDGTLDVVVGGLTEETGGVLAGATWVVWGPFEGVIQLTTDAWMFYGETEGDQAGNAVAMGQMDGDGIADAMTAASGRDRGASDVGAVYLLPLAP